MSTLVAFTTVTTVTTTLPTLDDSRGSLLRKVAERDQQLVDHGRYGYHLLNTVTVTGTEFVTVIDTLTREND